VTTTTPSPPENTKSPTNVPSTLELSDLAEQRCILEEDMKPKYSEAQYKNSVGHIEADEHRLMAVRRGMR